MTTAMTRASGTIRVHPESASQMISLRLWIVPREARSQQRWTSLKSSCKRSDHGIQVPIMRQSIATSSGGHSAIPVAARRTRCQWTKNLKTATKGTRRTTRSSRMLHVTPDLQEHKPSNHICTRIKSLIYTTELSRYHNTYHEIKAYKL
jgi:hypothetical protein